MNLWIYRLVNVAAVAATIGPWLVTKEMNGFSYCVSLAGLITVNANSRLRKKYIQGLDQQLIGFVSFLVGLALGQCRGSGLAMQHDSRKASK